MKKVSKDFKVGDRVARFEQQYNDNDEPIKPRFDAENYPIFGVITGVIFNSAPAQVVVKWDPPEWDRKRVMDPKIVPAKDLQLEAPLKASWSKMEAEFELLEKQVADKLKEAGKLLREANKIAKKSGRDLAEMYNAIDPLYSAMDACGWRTSSFSC
jgi:hypothetical protein